MSVRFSEFESFRSELRALATSTQGIQHRTLRDEGMRERFRTLFRIWVSSVQPSLKQLTRNTRDVFKLSAEIEKLAQLASKYKQLSEYRKRLRIAIQLADALVIYLPTDSQAIVAPSRHDLFITSIPDLAPALVPNPLLGWKSRMELFLRKHPFDKSVFIMIRYRRRNDGLIKSLKSVLEAGGLSGILASDHNITDDLYNPIACLLCCSRGIAVFDRAEQGQEFNPNVAYELGMLHLLGRACLILKHRTLRTLQTDILMKLYQSFSGPAEIANLTAEWVGKLAEAQAVSA